MDEMARREGTREVVLDMDGFREAPEMSPRIRLAVGIGAVVIALLSFFLLGGYFSTPEAYGPTIESLDAKKDTVMGLVAGCTGASVAISFLPGDAGTPIATELVGLGSDFMVVIAAIYLEKYLLTISGFAAFKILIPLSCLLVVIAVAMRGEYAPRGVFTRLAAKLTLLALAVFLTVPASVFISDMIESTYQSSLSDTLTTAQQASNQVAEASGGAGLSGSNSGTGEDTGILEKIASAFEDIPGGVSGAIEAAKNALNGFIEAFAVMVVTSCILPVLVLAFFLWLVSVILGINIETSALFSRSRLAGRRIMGPVINRER